MPRLPDKTALGGPAPLARRPIINPGNLATGAMLPKGIADTTVPIPLSVANTGAGFIASGAQSLAGSVGAIAEADLATDITRADAQHQKDLIELRRKYETDPDYATFPERFGAEAVAATDNAASMIRSPRLREGWLDGKATLEIARTRDQVMRRRDDLARQDKRDELDAALGDRATAYGLAQSDEERAQIERAAKEDIQLGTQSGVLRPQDARKLWQTRIQGMKTADATARINKSYLNPEEGFANLRDLTGQNDQPPEPSTGATSDRGLEFIRRKEGFNPNAVWDARRYSAGYGSKAEPGQTFTREQAEARLKEDTGSVDKWITANVKVPLTQRQHDALVSFGYNLGTGELDKLKDDINAGDASKVAERMKTFNKSLDQETGQLREKAGLSLRRMEEAEMYQNQGPSPRYADLDYHQRQVLIKHQRDALTTAVQDDAKKAIEDLSHGRPLAVDDKGLTAFDRMRMVATPNQAQKISIAAQEAYMKGRVLYGDGDKVAPISDLPETEAEKRINSIPRERPQKYVTGVWQKLLDQRYKDPAQAVSGATVAGPAGTTVGVDENGGVVLRDTEGSEYKVPPAKEVRGAKELIQGRVPDVQIVQNADGSLAVGKAKDPAAAQKAWGMLFDARLAAQDRLGIPKTAQRTITLREARDLLDMRKDDMDEEQFQALITKAQEKAKDMYGPRAGRVLGDAVELVVKDRNNKANGREMARGLITGQLDPDTLLSQSAARAFDDRYWKSGEPTLPSAEGAQRGQEMIRATEPGSFDPWMGARTPGVGPAREAEITPQPNMTSESVAPGLSVGYPQPNATQIKWLKDHKDDAHALTVFRSRFGSQAARDVLGR